MEQEKINKYLRWFVKAVRIVTFFAIAVDAGVMVFAGGFLWANGRDVMVSLPAWQLAFGVAERTIRITLMSYVVFGRWHLEYTKKAEPLDPTLIGKDW